MGHLRIKANESKYKVKHRIPKEQLSYKAMTEIIRKLSAVRKTSEFTGEQVLTLARRVEV